MPIFAPSNSTHTHTHTYHGWAAGRSDQQWCQWTMGRLWVAFCSPNPKLYWKIFINYVLFRKWQVNDASCRTYSVAPPTPPSPLGSSHSPHVVMIDTGQREWNNWSRISRADWRLKHLIALNCPRVSGPPLWTIDNNAIITMKAILLMQRLKV